MARNATKELRIDWEGLVEFSGGPQAALDEIVRIAAQQSSEQTKISLRSVVEQFGLDSLRESLTPAERAALKRKLGREH
jgi:hypothetical protein